MDPMYKMGQKLPVIATSNSKNRCECYSNLVCQFCYVAASITDLDFKLHLITPSRNEIKQILTQNSKTELLTCLDLQRSSQIWKVLGSKVSSGCCCTWTASTVSPRTTTSCSNLVSISRLQLSDFKPTMILWFLNPRFPSHPNIPPVILRFPSHCKKAVQLKDFKFRLRIWLIACLSQHNEWDWH